MKTPEPFWRTVDAILDARGDLRRDARVREWLCDHPADARELERLEEALVALEREAPRRTARKRRRVALTLVAGFAALALAFSLARRQESHDAGGRPSPIVERPPIENGTPRTAPLAVDRWEIEIVTESVAGRRSTLVRDGRVERDERSTGFLASSTASLAGAFQCDVRTERSIPR